MSVVLYGVAVTFMSSWSRMLYLGGYNAMTHRYAKDYPEYCRSGNFRVFRFSRICDLEAFEKVRNRYYNNYFREIPKFANLSSSRNLRKLKPREFYQIYSKSHSLRVTLNNILYKLWRPREQFEIIINVLVSSFCLIWIPMLRVYGNYKYFTSSTRGPSIDVRIWRL